MKYLIILGDGMADEPIPELGGLTPLQAAEKPEIDWLAAHGRNGLLDTIPAGFAPGSEIANLSILGYDLPKVFEGRGSLEAASMGVPILDGEMAMRCNLITVENGIIRNHSAGQISTEEADILIAFLQEELGGEAQPFNSKANKRITTPRLNYHLHRKIVAIDGKLGYIGGFNIGDQYLGEDPKFGYWRDTHLKIYGDAEI